MESQQENMQPTENSQTNGHTPPAPQSFLAWLRTNWGWAAVLGAGILLVISSIFFIAAVLLVPETPADRLPRKPTRTPLALGTAAPVDIQTLPTSTTAPNASGPTPSSAPTITDQGYQMVLVPAGPFRMGTTDDELAKVYAICDPILGHDKCLTMGFEEERPPHQVTLDAFYVDQYEITNEQYAAFLNDMGNKSTTDAQWYKAGDEKARIQFLDGKWRSIQGYEKHPVTEVTWYGADAFCQWRTGKLPTEAEWEKSARWNPATNDVSIYPWGSSEPTGAQANYAMTGNNTRPVGSLEGGKSALGIYDLAGNVFEWVSDWYGPGGYSSPDPSNEPTGPANGQTKVIKGGSWGDNAFFLRGANRGNLIPAAGTNFVGFRCVKDAASIVIP